MLKGILTTIAVGLALAGTASGTTPKKPTAAHQLAIYLKAMQKPATALAKANNFADTTNYFYSQWIGDQFGDSAGSDWNDFASEAQRAHDTGAAAAAAIRHVKAPAAMRGPHALFVARAAAFETQEQAVATKAGGLDASQWVSDPSSEPVSTTINLGSDAVKAQDALQQAEVNWRQELIVQLRRAKITVPLWVKQVGQT